MTAYAASWNGASFMLEPRRSAAANADYPLTPRAAAGTAGVRLDRAAAVVAGEAGGLEFELRTSTAADFHSLTASQIGNLLLQIQFTA